jgi:hypothetical protein
MMSLITNAVGLLSSANAPWFARKIDLIANLKAFAWAFRHHNLGNQLTPVGVDLPELWLWTVPKFQVLKRNEVVPDYNGQPTHEGSSLSDLRRMGSRNPGIPSE